MMSIALRIAALFAIVISATWAVHLVRDTLELTIMPINEQAVHRAIMLGTLAYIGLLALPFVPGAEIGVAMLAAFGANIAPLIYVATVTSMMLAFTIGRLLPIDLLARLLTFLRLRRAAQLVADAAPLAPDQRMALLLDGAPPRALRFALQNRYIALALSVNVPGNSLIGGGGGIMLLAGMSGIFKPFATLLSVAVAVAPVPLAVTFFGA